MADFRVTNPDKMNDFLRPCNCVNPAEEDCEKCVGEVAAQKAPETSGEKDSKKEKPKVEESEKKDLKSSGAASGVSAKMPR